MKKTFSLLISLVALIVLISGFSLAYLSYKGEEKQINFTTGKLQIDIEMPAVNDSWDNWKPGEAKEISWTFKNAGTQAAFVRINFSNNWTKNELPESVYYSGYIISDDDPEPTVNWVLRSDDWYWEDGNYYFNGEVAPNEVITVNFEVTMENLTPSYLCADYNLSLFLDSVQAVSNPNPVWD